MTNPLSEPEIFGESIAVVIRIRPMMPGEVDSLRCITADKTSITVDTKQETKQFAFDYVAGETESQETIFEKTGKPLTEACFKGTI